MNHVIVEKSHKYKSKTGGPLNWHYTYDEGIGKEITKPVHQQIVELNSLVDHGNKLDKLLEQQKAEEFVDKLTPKQKLRLTNRKHNFDNTGKLVSSRKWIKTPHGDIDID
jgi:hypothetical protein